MVSLLEIIFTTVFLFWTADLILFKKLGMGYKAAFFIIGSFFLFALWNRPLGGQWGLPDFNPLVAVLASVGVVIAGNWAHDKWGPDGRVKGAIIAAVFGLILLFCWPFFIAGPASITPSIAPAASPPLPPVAAPAPVPAIAPAPAPRALPAARPARVRRHVPDPDCLKLSPRAQAALGGC